MYFTGLKLILKWLFPGLAPVMKTELAVHVVITVFVCVCVCLYVVVHVPAVQEPGLHPFVRDLSSGHQAPESAAGSRDRRSQTLRLRQVRRSDQVLSSFDSDI